MDLLSIATAIGLPAILIAVLTRVFAGIAERAPLRRLERIAAVAEKLPADSAAVRDVQQLADLLAHRLLVATLPSSRPHSAWRRERTDRYLRAVAVAALSSGVGFVTVSVLLQLTHWLPPVVADWLLLVGVSLSFLAGLVTLVAVVLLNRLPPPPDTELTGTPAP